MNYTEEDHIEEYEVVLDILSSVGGLTEEEIGQLAWENLPEELKEEIREENIRFWAEMEKNNDPKVAI